MGKTITGHLSLYRAKQNKNNEFYTKMEDIECIMEEYYEQDPNFLKDKVIYLPCDDDWSNFKKYFINNKDKFKYKKLLTNALTLPIEHPFGQEYPTGDFRLKPELFDEADIVITNPPFSLGRILLTDYLLPKKKDFILILNALIYISVDIQPYYLNQTFYQIKPIFTFINPEGEVKRVHASWFSTIRLKKYFSVQDFFNIIGFCSSAIVKETEETEKVLFVRIIATIKRPDILKLGGFKSYEELKDKLYRANHKGSTYLNCEEQNLIPYDIKEPCLYPLTLSISSTLQKLYEKYLLNKIILDR